MFVIVFEIIHVFLDNMNKYYFIFSVFPVYFLKRQLRKERRRSFRLLNSLRAARSDVKAYRNFVRTLERKIQYLKNH
jgi:hypothetical protein